jgi:hypothetical protein
MDMAQGFLFDAGWIFFAVWGMILAALGAITFRKDIAPSEDSGKSAPSEIRSARI